VTSLPASVRRSVEETLSVLRGNPVTVSRTGSIAGGCINPSARIDTSAGESFFLKWNAGAPPEMFEAEADGLEALAACGASCGLRVPDVLGVGTGEGGATPWLLLELVERGRETPEYGERLGRGVAALHGAGGLAGYGWSRDNFIGALPQANPVVDRWAELWRDARLAPQLGAARQAGHFAGEDGRTLDRLVARVERALEGTETEAPALLHGDLWSGNAYPGPNGEPVLIDPAVYRGHREVDLAMSELFGGFPPTFLRSYEDARPLGEGYRRVRRPLYQLYYLLVHVNLFGGGYVARSLAAARAVLAEL
jgi:fructosamine-3-kinase